MRTRRTLLGFLGLTLFTLARTWPGAHSIPPLPQVREDMKAVTHDLQAFLILRAGNSFFSLNEGFWNSAPLTRMKQLLEARASSMIDLYLRPAAPSLRSRMKTEVAFSTVSARLHIGNNPFTPGKPH